MVRDGEGPEVTVVIAEFGSGAQALKAYDDLLERNRAEGKQALYATRLAQGPHHLVAAVCWTGFDDLIVDHFERLGGQLADLPHEQKVELVDRFVAGVEQGVVGERRNIMRPLREPPSDPTRN